MSPKGIFFDAGFGGSFAPPKSPEVQMSPSSDHKPSGQKGPQENWKKIGCQL